MSAIILLIVGLTMWAISQGVLTAPLLRYNPPRYPRPVVWLCWVSAAIGGALAGSGFVQVVWG